MIMWKATTGTPRISKEQVDRETESSVWINGHRRQKRTDYESYFKTWEEAKSHLVEYFHNRRRLALRSLDFAQKDVNAVDALVEPE